MPKSAPHTPPDAEAATPQQRPRYALDELLAQCNPEARRTSADREWLSSGSAGAEIL